MTLLYTYIFFQFEYQNEHEFISADMSTDTCFTLRRSVAQKNESRTHSWAKFRIVLLRKPERKFYYFTTKFQGSGFSFQSLNQNIKVVHTEVRFASFLSGGFITAIVVNQPERKLAKCTSVEWLNKSSLANIYKSK